MWSYTTVSPSATWTWTTSSGFFLAAMSALLGEEPGYPDDAGRVGRDQVAGAELRLIRVEQPRAVDVDRERLPPHEYDALDVVNVCRVGEARRARGLGHAERRRSDHRHAEDGGGLGVPDVLPEVAASGAGLGLPQRRDVARMHHDPHPLPWHVDRLEKRDGIREVVEGWRRAVRRGHERLLARDVLESRGLGRGARALEDARVELEREHLHEVVGQDLGERRVGVLEDLVRHLGQGRQLARRCDHARERTVESVGSWRD